MDKLAEVNGKGHTMKYGFCPGQMMAEQFDIFEKTADFLEKRGCERSFYASNTFLMRWQ